MTRRALGTVERWPDDFTERYRDAGYWHDENFADWWRSRMELFGDRQAVVGVNASDRHTLIRQTYRELDLSVGRTAQYLHDRNIAAGDRVIVQLPNTLQYLHAVLALFRLGALPIFALPAHRDRELTQFCLVADVTAHLVAAQSWDKDTTAVAEKVRTNLSQAGAEPPQLIDVETWQLPDQPLTESNAPPATEPALLQLSGGTTGVPKLIPRTAADYLYSVRESAKICALDSDSALLVTLPAAHNFPMSSPGSLGTLHSGGTVVFAADPSPRTSFSLIQSEHVTHASLVPPLLQAWLAAGSRSKFDLSSLRVIGVGGAKLADAVAERVRPELSAQLQQIFGMAEGLVCYTRLDDPLELVTTTQGQPISPADEIRVVDDHDNPVPDGAEGHLLTRGPYTIRGYYRAPEQNATSFTSDGFYRTGDLVRQLDSGHLVVTGRAKDQINRAGEKIATDEVEDVLLRHPQVHDAVLVPVPDTELGERSCAVVIAADAALTAADLRGTVVDSGLATFKIPDEFRFVDSFPVTGVGKTSRRQLRQLLLTTIDNDDRRRQVTP